MLAGRTRWHQSPHCDLKANALPSQLWFLPQNFCETFIDERRKETHMKFDIVRAWKDQSYRQSLSQEQLSQLPANPAGEVELSDATLASIYGGDDWEANGWGDNSNFDKQQNSNICSVICSHNCKIDILDLLNLDIL